MVLTLREIADSISLRGDAIRGGQLNTMYASARGYSEGIYASTGDCDHCAPWPSEDCNCNCDCDCEVDDNCNCG